MGSIERGRFKIKLVEGEPVCDFAMVAREVENWDFKCLDMMEAEMVDRRR
jgi:hypothetical protein